MRLIAPLRKKTSTAKQVRFIAIWLAGLTQSLFLCLRTFSTWVFNKKKKHILVPFVKREVHDPPSTFAAILSGVSLFFSAVIWAHALILFY